MSKISCCVDHMKAFFNRFCNCFSRYSIVKDNRLMMKNGLPILVKSSEGGIIISDNVDWYVSVSPCFKEQGMVQLDFSGFGPIND